MTVRIARWSATHPWRAMGLWTVFVLLSIALGTVVGTKEADGSGNVGETQRASDIIDSGAFPPGTAEEHILVTARSGALDQVAARAALDDAATRLRALSEVDEVRDPVPAQDGSALMLAVAMTGDPDTAADRVQPLLDTTTAVARDHPGLRIEEVGEASIDKGLGESIDADFVQAEVFSVGVTLLILLVVFGALIAAGVPVLLGLSAVGSAIGLSALVSYLLPAQEQTNSVILLIGMAVGVDYSLFYLKREREERAKGAGHIDAVEIAAATSGHAVVVSGIAVVIAMGGMFLAKDPIFTSIALGSVLVVAVSVLGSLTVLPALLAKLGRWVDRPRIPFLWRLTAPRKSAGTPRFWSAVLRPALRYPLVTFLASAGVLVALAIPALGMNLKFPDLGDLPRTTPVLQAYDRLTTAYPSTGGGHLVVVRASAAQADQVRQALLGLGERAAADPLFAHDLEPEVELSPNRTVSLLSIGTPYESGTPEGVASLHRLRDDLLPAALGGLGVEYAVTGDIAGTTDYSDHIWEKLPIVVGFVLLLTFLVMAWTFRSVVVALTAIVLNLLSVAAAYGVLVLVFQRHWAETLLDFKSNGGIVSWLPLFLFVVLFGLSMDYHVFVVSRIREAVQAGQSTRDAVAYGIIRSAGVVTSAAVVMVGVFGIFGTLSTLDLKQLGVGLATAILIDATIIRAVVLPSLMTLLGDANWWAPRFLRRRPTTPAVPAESSPRDDLAPVG
jgi:putative drug exporter of the RND superfamily